MINEILRVKIVKVCLGWCCKEKIKNGNEKMSFINKNGEGG